MSELRDTIREAMNASKEAEEADAPAVLEEPAEVTHEEPAEKPAAKAEGEKDTEKDEKEKPAAKDGRDEKGRFAAKEKAAADAKAAAVDGVKTVGDKAAPVAAAQADGKPAPQAAEQVKAPQSWTPAAREEWAKVPPLVQREVARREREAAVAIQQGAEARRFNEQFQQAVRPYEGMIAAAGSNPIQAAARLMQTAAALRTEPGPTKARIVADLIKQYGVPVQDLDDILSGQAPAQGQQQRGQTQDPRVDQLLHQLAQERQGREQQTTTQATQQIEQFAAAHEFFHDVEPAMVEIIRINKARGQNVTLQQAYDRALAIDPDISNIVKQREAAKAASTGAASTQRAKNAASSVRSKPSSSVEGAQPDDLRSTIRAAIAANAGR